MFESRPPRWDLVESGDGWLFALHLDCGRLDMRLSISVRGVPTAATLEVEAVDPSWTLPRAANELALLEAIRHDPAPLWVERVTMEATHFNALLDDLRSLRATELEDAPVEGLLDGWNMRAVMAGPGLERRIFSTTSPSTTERKGHHAFVRLLLDTAKGSTARPGTHLALAKWEQLV